MHNRRSGSTTVAMKAAKENGAILIAHNQEYARQIGGISQSELQRHWGKPQPILFDNGLLIKMCEDYRHAEVDRTNQEILEWESEFEARVGERENRLNLYYNMKVDAVERRVPSAIQLGRLGAIPALTARVPLNEMKFYLQRGFPRNVWSRETNELIHP